MVNKFCGHRLSWECIPTIVFVEYYYRVSVDRALLDISIDDSHFGITNVRNFPVNAGISVISFAFVLNLDVIYMMYMQFHYEGVA